nr:hypothetical protein [Anaerolineae bacterium]
MFLPEFNIFDQILLLLTGLVAIYLLWRFFTRYRKEKKLYDIYYMVAFAVLLVAGLLLIFFGYGQLDSPLVEIVGVLIPAGLALGLITQFYEKYSKPYLIFVLVFVVLVAITRFVLTGLGTPVLVIIHAISGLVILVAPILAVKAGKTRGAFASVSLGGLLIDAGGMALAFLAIGKQLLFFSGDLVMSILAGLLLLMSLAFAYGFVRDIRHNMA